MFQSSALLVWTSLPHAVVFYVWNVRRCQQQGAFLGLTAAVSWAPPADRPWARCFLYSILFNAHRAPRAWTLRLQEVTPPVRDLPQSWRWPLPAATCWAEEGLLCTWATNLGHRSLLGDKESHPPLTRQSLQVSHPCLCCPGHLSMCVQQCVQDVCRRLRSPLHVYGSKGWAQGTGRATYWGMAGPGTVTNGGKWTWESSCHDEWEVLSTGPGACVLHVLCYGQSPTWAPWVSTGPRRCALSSSPWPLCPLPTSHSVWADFQAHPGSASWLLALPPASCVTLDMGRHLLSLSFLVLSSWDVVPLLSSWWMPVL